VHDGKQVNVCSWQDISSLVEIRAERARTIDSLASQLDQSVMSIVEAVFSPAAELNLAAGSLQLLPNRTSFRPWQ
jgi:hypothetical protein